jgi:hypothetical protein
VEAARSANANAKRGLTRDMALRVTSRRDAIPLRCCVLQRQRPILHCGTAKKAHLHQIVTITLRRPD